MNGFLYIFFLFLLTDTLSVDQRYSYDQLERHLTKARQEQNHQELGKTYYLLGLEEERITNREKAFEFYTRSIDYFKLTKDTANIYLAKEKLAKSHKEASLYFEADEIYNELYDYYTSQKDTTNMVLCLLSLSELNVEKLEFEQSYDYLKQALQLGSTLENPDIIIQLDLHQADLYLKFKEFDKALDHALSAFFLSDSLSKIDFSSISLYYVGIINGKLGKKDLATKYLQNSIAVLDKKPMDKRRLGLYRELYQNYEKREVYDSAYMYSVQYARLKDSILNRDRVASINNLSMKYQAREKSKEVILLEKEKEFANERNEQKNRALYTLAIIAGLLLVLLYFIIRFFTTRIQASSIIGEQKEKLNQQRIEKLEDELKIKSMVSVIEGQETERERISKDLHDSMGGLLATIKLQVDGLNDITSPAANKEKNLEVQSMLDFAVSEVRSISQNLQPAALKNLGLIAAINDLVNRLDDPRYPEVEFQHYDVPKLDNMMSLSIYRMLQEMLNNTIKHAKAKEIFIQLRKEGDALVLSYEDDGIGFDLETQQGKGLGLGNIESRANYLKGELSLDSREAGGCSYIIHIPLNEVV